jgi:hypothetical protein
MRRPTARASASSASPLLPGGGRTAVALGLLTAVWLVTRVVLFMQMHDAAGFEIDALPDFLHRRRTAAPAHVADAGGVTAAGVAVGGKAAAVTSAGAGSVHVVLTSNGNSYMNWQTRVMYATYLAVAARDPGGALARGAFTRVLHRSTDDELMVEVPTMRFTPAHVNCDVYCSFPVADRAPALVEWSRTDDAQRCTHILLVGARTGGRLRTGAPAALRARARASAPASRACVASASRGARASFSRLPSSVRARGSETDYLFVKPLADELLPQDGRAVAFPFGCAACRPRPPARVRVCA